jgi:adenylate cyclase
MDTSDTFRFGSFQLLAGRRELRCNGAPVAIGSRAFDLLLALVRRRGQLATKGDLMAEVWSGRVVEENNLQAQISALRKVLAREAIGADYLQTVPGRGYRFLDQVVDMATSTGVGAATLPLPDGPSIAVLPFTNMSGDPKQEYFADGIVEDMTTELSRFQDLFVIARNSSFQYKGKSVDVRRVGFELGVRYVLEGSIRRSGDRVRISVQLIDAVTGSHRWAERYDRTLEDIYAVQDEVVRTIVAILAAHVNKAETERILLKPPATWQAYDYYMRGTAIWNSYWSSLKTEELYQARRFFERSFAIDATYARACAMLSITYITAWTLPAFSSDYRNPDAIDQAYQMARKGVQLDPYSPQALGALGLALACKGQHEASIAAYKKAVVLNPNYSNRGFALALVCAGEPMRAIEVIKAHMRLDPFYPPVVPLWSGIAHYMLHRYLEALPLLRESASRAPNFLHAAHAWLAACYAQMGRLGEARVEAAEVLRIEPKYTIDGTARRRAGVFIKSPVDAEHYFDGLRKAGLPDN